MSGIFDYVPHPHAEKRKEAGPPTVAAAVAQLHGPGPIGRFNAKVGLKVTVRGSFIPIHAAIRRYSWISPPSRSTRTTVPSPRRRAAPGSGVSSARPRCGRSAL